MAVKRLFSAVVVFVLLGQAGCFWFTSKHEGQTLRSDIDRIDGEVQTKITAQVAELQKVLAEATELLKRNSANLGSELDGLVQENGKLTGLVMEAKRVAEGVKQSTSEQNERLDDLEKRLAAIEEKINKTPRISPEKLFTEGKALFDAGQWVPARGLFKQIIIRHGASQIAGEAQYYRAESHFRERDYQAAIGEFQKVYDKYKKSRRRDEALYRAGESAEKLAWCTDANAYFGVMIKRFPRSSLVKRAKKKISALKKLAKKKRCKR